MALQTSACSSQAVLRPYKFTFHGLSDILFNERKLIMDVLHKLGTKIMSLFTRLAVKRQGCLFTLVHYPRMIDHT